MKTRTMYFIGAALSSGVAFYHEAWAVGMILLVGHVLSYQMHALEVRVNKLLNERGLLVSDAEIAE